jgi:hypothetical protein
LRGQISQEPEASFAFLVRQPFLSRTVLGNRLTHDQTLGFPLLLRDPAKEPDGSFVERKRQLGHVAILPYRNTILAQSPRRVLHAPRPLSAGWNQLHNPAA